jgi:hypothetical protein
MMIAILVLAASSDRSNAAAGDCRGKSKFRRPFCPCPRPHACPIHARSSGAVQGEPWFAPVGTANAAAPIAARAPMTALGPVRTATLRVFMFYVKRLSGIGNSAICIVLPFRD